MEQYVYISFANGFRGWYRDPEKIAGLGDLVYAPLRADYELGEVILVHHMTAEEARFFYPSRIKRVDEVYKRFEDRPEAEKETALKLYEKMKKVFEANPERFAFRV